MSKKELIKAARQALKDADYRSCLTKCKELLGEDAQSYDAFLMIGKAAYCLEEYEQSEVAYTQATIIEPSSPQAWQGMNELHSKTQNWLRLGDVLERLVSLYQTSEADQALQGKIRGLQIKMADAYAKIGTIEGLVKAEVVLTGLSEDEEPSVDLLCQLADVQLQLDGLDATKCLEKITSLTSPSPLHIKYYDALLRIKLKARDPDAMNLASRMLQDGCSALASEVILLSHDLKETPLGLVSHQAHRFPDSSSTQLHLILTLLRRKMTLTDSMAQRLSICLSDDSLASKVVSGYIVAAATEIKGNCPSESLSLSRKGLAALAERGIEDKESESATSLLKLFVGRALVALGKFQEAETILTELHQSPPGPCDLLRELGLFSCPLNLQSETSRFLIKAKQGKGDHEASKKMIDSMIADPSTGSDPSFAAWLQGELGHLLLQEGNLDSARVALEAAIATIKEAESMDVEPSEDLPHFRVWLAQAYQRLGGEWASTKGKWAHEQLMVAAAVEGAHQASAFAALGEWYDRASDQTRAIKCYQRSLALDPSQSQAGEGLSRLLVASGEIDKAIAILKSLDALSNPPQWILRCLGYLELKSAISSHGDLAKREAAAAASISTFQRALRSEPSSSDLWEGLAEAYRLRGRQTAALKAFRRALELDDKRIHSASSAAALEHQQGVASESWALYSQAISLSSGSDPSALLGAAEAKLSSAQTKLWSGMEGSANIDLSEAERLAEMALSPSVSTRPLEASWKILGDAQLLHSAVNSLSTKTAAAARASLMARADSARKARCSYAHLLHLSPTLSGVWGDLSTSCKQEAQLLLLASPLANPPGITSKSQVYSPQELSTLGQKLVRGGLAIEPSSDWLWSCAGSQHAFAMQLGSHDDKEKNAAAAEYCYSRALTLNPRRAGTWAALGRLYSGLVERGEGGPGPMASKCFEMARSHQPTLAATWEAMCYLSSRATSVDKGHVIELQRHALGLGGGLESRLACTSDDLATKAEGLSAGAAVATLMRCVRQVPTLAAAHSLLGLALEEKGGEDLQGAVEAHEAALTIASDPSFSNLLSQLVSLELGGAVADTSNDSLAHKQALKINLARCLSKLATNTPPLIPPLAIKAAADRSLFLFESLEREGALQKDALAWISYAEAARVAKPDQGGLVLRLLESGVAASGLSPIVRIRLLSRFALCQELVRQGQWMESFEAIRSATLAPSDGPEAASLSLSMWLLLISLSASTADSPIPMEILREEILTWAASNEAHLDMAQVMATLDSISALSLLSSDPTMASKALRPLSKSVHTCPWDQSLRMNLAMLASSAFPRYSFAASCVSKGSLDHAPLLRDQAPFLRDVSVSPIFLSGPRADLAIDKVTSRLKLMVKAYPDSYVPWFLLSMSLMKEAESSSAGPANSQYLRAKAALLVALRKARDAFEKAKSRTREAAQAPSKLPSALPPALRLRTPQAPAAPITPPLIDSDLALVILNLIVALRVCHLRTSSMGAEEFTKEARDWCSMNNLDSKLVDLDHPSDIHNLFQAKLILEQKGQASEAYQLLGDPAQPAALALKSLACLGMISEASDANASKKLALEARFLASSALTLQRQLYCGRKGVGDLESDLLRCILSEAEAARGKADKAKEELDRVPEEQRARWKKYCG